MSGDKGDFAPARSATPAELRFMRELVRPLRGEAPQRIPDAQVESPD